MGSTADALKDMDKSTTLDPTFTQTWIKKASVHMEAGASVPSSPSLFFSTSSWLKATARRKSAGDGEAAFRDFDEAIKVDPNDPDVYYHRGQVYFVTGQYASAIEDYKRASERDSAFIFSQIQLAVAYYKQDQSQRAIHLFKKCLERFGETSAEVHNYYGELLLDQKQWDEAIASFDRAIALEKQR
jgi:mitochondrial import receptor subunit TOM70